MGAAPAARRAILGEGRLGAVRAALANSARHGSGAQGLRAQAQGVGGRPLTSVIALPMSPATSFMLPGTIIVFVVRASWL